MAGFYLSKRSKDNLQGVHPDLVRVVERAIQLTKVDFVVTEGLRSLARQRQLKDAGASKTLRSRHITGHAVDLAAIVGKDIRWDWPLYPQLAAAMKQAARELGVPLEWGGDWKSFKDGPHFQLPFAEYPG
ncbi:M15 family metallopeptidase [Lysobacter sp. ESA13C]|uniref:M15 family metallopeptidase n=1 Tax=Lysobacter sp. ESA13C TaxID=2862676 RepID=UPI001CBBBBD5|nr:M15 family metallopeptidase [Lysobacter sp. ESA13C]